LLCCCLFVVFPSRTSQSLCSSLSFLMTRPPPRSTLFPYTTLFRSLDVPVVKAPDPLVDGHLGLVVEEAPRLVDVGVGVRHVGRQDRKSTRLNSSHVKISYAVFCLKKKK